MIWWVLYDIENDRARSRVARYCKQAGLYRVQYSVFAGKMERDAVDSLHLQIEAEINPERDKVYFFPLAAKTVGQAILLGQAFDRKLVSGVAKTLLL